MRSAIKMAWEHGGADFQSRVDNSTAQAEEMTVIILVAGFLLEVIYRLLKDRVGLTEHVDLAPTG